MGLDQYAYIRPPRKRNSDDDEQIAEWRKHNRLQGYMQSLWESKGCPKENDETPGEFNCVELQLSAEDIDNFEQAMTAMEFPEANGFFWGSDSYKWNSEAGETDRILEKYYYRDRDQDFINDAREALAKGYRVYYSSWY